MLTSSRLQPLKLFWRNSFLSRLIWFLLTLIIVFAWSSVASAQAPSSLGSTPDLKIAIDTVWVLFTGTLIFFMNAGFCMLETGFCRIKNATNLLSKNLIVFALSTVAYWAIGFGIMFGDGTPFFGSNGFFLSGADNSPLTGDAYQGVFDSLSWTGIPLQTKFFFQLAFAGTAATIVSGAVAERIRYLAFFAFTFPLVAIAYPVIGHWIWGRGWLADLGFWDFAGSTVVHSVGGWAGLVGAIMLGPRLGRYAEKATFAMPGHNLSIATLGCLILWLGWFGFNPGSVMAVEPKTISHILLTTNMSIACGGIAATLMSWRNFGKPDLTMTINGILAGAVGITASCAFVTIPYAVVIGSVAGMIVVLSISFMDRLHIDDPVGAISVHLVCGVWGTLAVGLFSVGPNTYNLYSKGPAAGLFVNGNVQQLLYQLAGIIAVGSFMVLFSGVIWLILKSTVGIRVSRKEESVGLDLVEHGMEAYNGFVISEQDDK
ncbi:MAG: ammonium transporter [Leptolyngbyaceae cyanobacterium RU_5_1]|nr:ammonium transporter [Leptolyngbyaceae cyanobacterium RU_5_1]